MKVPKEARKLARTLLRSSFADADAPQPSSPKSPQTPPAQPSLLSPAPQSKRLDRARAAAAMQSLAARKPRHLLAALREYHRLVRLELARRHAVIESAAPLAPADAAGLLASLQTRFGGDLTHETKTTPALIGGVRIRVGSDVWDNSVKGRLDRLGAALGG